MQAGEYIQAQQDDPDADCDSMTPLSASAMANKP